MVHEERSVARHEVENRSSTPESFAEREREERDEIAPANCSKVQQVGHDVKHSALRGAKHGMAPCERCGLGLRAIHRARSVVAYCTAQVAGPRQESLESGSEPSSDHESAPIRCES